MSSKAALSAVVTAIYTALVADTTLMGLLKQGLWDHPPDLGQQAPPYAFGVLLDWEEDQEDTGGLQVRTVKGTVRLASTYEGMRDLYAMLDRVVLLRRQTLVIEGWTCDAVFYDGATPGESELLEEKVLLQQLVVRLRVVVTEVIA